MRGVTTDRRCWTTPPAPLSGRQRLVAGRPQDGGGLDANGIRQADFGDAIAKVGVVAVACVGQDQS